MSEKKQSTSAKATADKPEKKSKIQELEQKCAEYLQGWKRAQADYQNLQKEIAKDREGFAKYSKINYLMGLLPLYNNLDAAFGYLPEDLRSNDWVKGISHIKDQFGSLLEEMKVEKIDTEDKKFDPSLHEAVAREVDETKKSGHIIREITPGYIVDGETLVPAKVVVVE